MSVILIKASEGCGISGAIAWHNEGGTMAYQGRLRGITGAVPWHIRGAMWHNGGVNRGVSGALVWHSRGGK